MACYLGASAIRTYQRRPAVDSVMELVKGPKSFALFMEDAMHNVIYAVIMLPSPLSSISILAMMSPVIFAFFQSASYMDSVFKVSCLLGVHGLRASNRHLAAVVFVIPAFVPGRTVAHASISFNLTPPSAAAWLSVEAHVSRADAQSGGLEGKGPVGTMPLLSLLSLVVAATLLGCSPHRHRRTKRALRAHRRWSTQLHARYGALHPESAAHLKLCTMSRLAEPSTAAAAAALLPSPPCPG